jgi:hypothetical protein
VPRIGDLRVVSGPFVGHSGLCTQVSRQQVAVLLLMFKVQRQVRLHRDAVELDAASPPNRSVMIARLFVAAPMATV